MSDWEEDEARDQPSPVRTWTGVRRESVYFEKPEARGPGGGERGRAFYRSRFPADEAGRQARPLVLGVGKPSLGRIIGKFNLSLPALVHASTNLYYSFFFQLYSFLQCALGRGGATIRALEDRSGARIKVISPVYLL